MQPFDQTGPVFKFVQQMVDIWLVVGSTDTDKLIVLVVVVVVVFVYSKNLIENHQHNGEW